MKRPLLVFLTGLLIGGLAVVGWFVWRDGGGRLPDEKKVAMELLTETLSGPGYFHFPEGTLPDEHGILWISPAHTASQIDRVMKERKLDESARKKLDRLLEEVTESHPSRVIGGDRINVARLNVALDAVMK
jgi:hypothetical protein